MERTKVIKVDDNSLGFEVGGAPKWRGEFTLEQIAEFGIKEGTDLTVHLLEMQDVFANVEFAENKKTTVQVTVVPENGDMFAYKPPPETDTQEG